MRGLGSVADAVGTRFMATKESEVHDDIKAVMVKARETDTTHIFRTLRNTARVFKNEVAKEVVSKEKQGATFEDIRHLVSGARGRSVYENGDPNAGIWTAGQTLGLIHDIPTCKELVERIESEALADIERIASMRRLDSRSCRSQL